MLVSVTFEQLYSYLAIGHFYFGITRRRMGF